jgi:hypothetical protein
MSRALRLCLWLGALAVLPAPAARGQGNPAERFEYREIRAPQGHVEHVVFSRDGSQMAAGAGASVVVWDVAGGKVIQRMQLPEKQIYHRLVFSTDGKTLIWNGREDPMVRVFDVKTGKQVREFRQLHGNNREGFSSYFLAYSPDGRRAAFHGATFFRGLDVHDLASGKVVLQLDVQDCRCCDFSADGKLITTHSSNGGVHVWEAATGQLVRELRPNDKIAGTAYCFVAFSPDAKFLATSSPIERTLQVWSLQTGKLTCTLPDKVYYRTAFFSRDNLSLLYVPDSTGRALLYNLLAEKAVYHFDPPHRLSHFAAFSPDGKRVAVIGPSSEGGGSGVAGQLSIYLYELPARALNPAAAHVDDAALDKLWVELGGDNELRLQLVRKAFRAAPKQAVEVLGKKVQPVARDLLQRVEQHITNLDDDAFTKRDQAMKELQGLAHQFAPLLEARLKQVSAGETRNRLTFILKQMGEEKPPRSLVMELRALTLLEEIGSPEARDLVSRLADGAPQARLTVEARTVLGRLPKAKGPSK